MKILITLVHLFHGLFVFGQTTLSKTPIHADSCNYQKLEKGSSSIGYNPLYLANGIVTGSGELDGDLAIDVTVIHCPESSRKFSYIASGGVILINTKQTFETVTPAAIRFDKLIKGEVIYALNGCLLLDSTLLISKKAIVEIEIFDFVNKVSEIVTCINIWTLPKAFRKS